MPTKQLAKALHTLTSVPNVAAYLATQDTYRTGTDRARAALLILNPDYDYSVAELARIRKARSNELIAKIVDACSAILAK